MAGHVLITGASAGIGAALATELARRGRAVGLVARRAEHLEQVAARVRAVGGQAAWAAADVADEGAMAAAVAQLEQVLGPCEALVANAGVLTQRPVPQLDLNETLHTLRVNLEGPIVSAGAVLPGMLARGRGHLILVSSLAAFRVPSGWSAYAASKAGASAWWEGARAELAPRGVACSVVYPGYIDTDMVKQVRSPLLFLQPAEQLAAQLADLLDRPRPVVYSPRVFSWVGRLGWWLPGWLSDPLIARLT